MKYGRKKISEIYSGYPYVEREFNGEKSATGNMREFLDSYLENIGTTDAMTQVGYLEEMRHRFSHLRAESEADYKKYGSLYFKLCLAAGILIAVLLA